MIVKDHISEDGALKLAKRIREFWADHGMKVTTTVFPISMGAAGDGKGVVYGIRSNMIDGRPPRVPA